MFKIPEWESDVPKTSNEFSNISVKKLRNKTLKSEDQTNVLNKNKKAISVNKIKSNIVKQQNIIQKKTIKNKNNSLSKRKIKSTFQNAKKNYVSFPKSDQESPPNVSTERNITKNVSKNKHVKAKPNRIINKPKDSLQATGPLNGTSTTMKKATSTLNIAPTSTKKVTSTLNGVDSSTDTTTIKERKRKNGVTVKENNLEVSNLDGDILDQVLMNEKRQKLNEQLQNDDREDVLFKEIKVEKKKKDFKKEQIRKLLQHNSLRTPTKVNLDRGEKLRERMLERLKSAQFRYLNEKLYTSSGTEAHQLFQSDPTAFKTYHEGYQQQLKKWPVNPLDLIVKRIQKLPKTHKIVDMGCGEAALSHRIPNPVRSFDLVANAPGVEVCDMAHTPLLAASMDVAVYCLALMGTELTQYLVEANRILKLGGHLLIAEVESRFEKVEDFTKEVERLGFKLKKLDKSHTVFFFMEFTKIRDPPAKKSKLPVLTLKPCVYKRR